MITLDTPHPHLALYLALALLPCLAGCAGLSRWASEHQAQLATTAQVAAGIAARAALNVAADQIDAQSKSRALAILAGQLRKNSAELVSAEDVRKLLTAWAPNDGAVWQDLSARVAAIAAEELATKGDGNAAKKAANEAEEKKALVTAAEEKIGGIDAQLINIDEPVKERKAALSSNTTGIQQTAATLSEGWKNGDAWFGNVAPIKSKERADLEKLEQLEASHREGGLSGNEETQLYNLRKNKEANEAAITAGDETFDQAELAKAAAKRVSVEARERIETANPNTAPDSIARTAAYKKQAIAAEEMLRLQGERKSIKTEIQDGEEKTTRERETLEKSRAQAQQELTTARHDQSIAEKKQSILTITQKSETYKGYHDNSETIRKAEEDERKKKEEEERRQERERARANKLSPKDQAFQEDLHRRQLGLADQTLSTLRPGFSANNDAIAAANEVKAHPGDAGKSKQLEEAVRKAESLNKNQTPADKALMDTVTLLTQLIASQQKQSNTMEEHSRNIARLQSQVTNGTRYK